MVWMNIMKDTGDKILSKIITVNALIVLQIITNIGYLKRLFVAFFVNSI